MSRLGRKQYLDIAKGLAIVAVVYAHAAAQVEKTSLYAHYLTHQVKLIFFIAMPLFFIVSGYFQRRRLEHPNFNHRTYLFKIGTSLLMPFYSLSLAFLCLNTIFSPLVHPPPLNAQLFTILFQQSNTNLMPSGVLWFLFVLFECAFFSYFLLKVLKIKPVLLLLFSAVLTFLADRWSSFYWFGFNKFCEYFLTYLIGYFFLKDFEKALMNNKRFIFIVFSFFISFVFIIFYMDLRIPALIINSGFIGPCGAACLLWFSHWLSRKTPKGVLSRVFSYYGRYSILIYVFHMPSFTFVKIILSLSGVASALGLYLSLFWGGLILPLAYGRVLAVVPKVYFFFLGRQP